MTNVPGNAVPLQAFPLKTIPGFVLPNVQIARRTETFIKIFSEYRAFS